MKLKQRPEDFVVRESWRFERDPRGPYRVYRMDKQKLSTFAAVERLCARFHLSPGDVSFCGLKDKQGRTEQLLAVRGVEVDLQDPDLRLTFLGRSAAPLSAANTTSNRFAVTVRDLSDEEVARLPESIAEVNRLGVVNYFDSQRFGSLKHGQGFIARDLMRGDFASALRNFLAKPSELDRSGDARVKGFFRDAWPDFSRRCPYPEARRYDRITRHLAERPGDFRGAFLKIEPRYRALQLFTYQSYLWNEGVRALVQDLASRDAMAVIAYQAGTLLFPRDLTADALTRLRELTFPLLGPDSAIAEGPVRRAVERVLAKEHLPLADLRVPDTPELFFKHEERPVLVFPGKLVAGRPMRDERNPERLKVNVAFTLPPGAYATLVVRRLFYYALARKVRTEQRAPARGPKESGTQRPLPSPSGPNELGPQRASPKPAREPVPGFLARQRARKAARQAARAQSVRRR